MLQPRGFPVAKEPSKKLANVRCNRWIFKQHPQMEGTLAIGIGQEGVNEQVDQNVVPCDGGRPVDLGEVDIPVLVDIAGPPE